MQIKCKIDCHAVDCQGCEIRQEQALRQANKEIENMRVCIERSDDKNIVALMTQLAIEIYARRELMSFYKNVLRERGVLPKEEKPNFPAATVGDWSC